MINYALQVADRVLFHVGVNNTRSRKAMEKLGAQMLEKVTVAYYGEPPRRNLVFCVNKPLE